MSDVGVPDALVLGASGTLGRAIAFQLEREGRSVLRGTRSTAPDAGWISLDGPNWASSIPPRSLAAVVWAHGANRSDAITDDAAPQVRQVFEANVVLVVESLRDLLRQGALRADASLVVVSSIWQNLARDGKLSYTVSKSALAGLVRSLVADLGPDGMRVNAVLPGVVDSAMSRGFLSGEQLSRIERETPSRRLTTPDEVAAVSCWLAGKDSSGLNGQFVTVDGGWSSVRHL